MKQIILNELTKCIYNLEPGQSFAIRDYDPETNDGHWYGFQRISIALDTDVIIFGCYGGGESLEIKDRGSGAVTIRFSELNEWIEWLLYDYSIDEVWVEDKEFERGFTDQDSALKDAIPIYSIKKGHGRCSLVRLEDGRHAAVFHVSDKEVELSADHTMESLFENQNTMPVFGIYIDDSAQAAALSNIFKIMAEQMKQEESEC